MESAAHVHHLVAGAFFSHLKMEGLKNPGGQNLVEDDRLAAAVAILAAFICWLWSAAGLASLDEPLPRRTIF
jgi:hypothetical protein